MLSGNTTKHDSPQKEQLMSQLRLRTELETAQMLLQVNNLVDLTYYRSEALSHQIIILKLIFILISHGI